MQSDWLKYVMWLSTTNESAVFRLSCVKKILWHRLLLARTKKRISGCHHSSVDSCAPSILPPWVRVPSTPSTLLSIYIWIASCGKDKKNKMRPGLAHFKINSQSQIFVLLHQVVLTANPSPLQLEDGWSVNGVGRHYSHKFGYGLMDAGAIVDLAARWPGIGKQVKLLLQLLRGQYFEAFLKMGYSQPLFLFVFSTNS